jgi:hypothetical protein
MPLFNGEDLNFATFSKLFSLGSQTALLGKFSKLTEKLVTLIYFAWMTTAYSIVAEFNSDLSYYL